MVVYGRVGSGKVLGQFLDARPVLGRERSQDQPFRLDRLECAFHASRSFGSGLARRRHIGGRMRVRTKGDRRSADEQQCCGHGPTTRGSHGIAPHQCRVRHRAASSRNRRRQQPSWQLHCYNCLTCQCGDAHVSDVAEVARTSGGPATGSRMARILANSATGRLQSAETIRPRHESPSHSVAASHRPGSRRLASMRNSTAASRHSCQKTAL